MANEAPERTPLMKRMLAFMVLLVAIAIAAWIVIGIVKTILWIGLAVVVAGAVLWALKTLVW
jgi:hypothetical protein